ncbi:hypothetical protein Tco_0569920 [Tanacetum coccineum]
MSKPANDEFSQHLSDDETSNHEDASDIGAAPKQQQQVIPQTTVISNIKLLILKKEEYDIWVMEMEHYLEFIDATEVWLAVGEKEWRLKNILLIGLFLRKHMRRFHGNGCLQKKSWEASELVQKGFENGYDRFLQITFSVGKVMVRKFNLEMQIHRSQVFAPRVFEQEYPKVLKNSSSAQNVAFVHKAKADLLLKARAGFADEVIIPSLQTIRRTGTWLHEKTWKQIDDLA